MVLKDRNSTQFAQCLPCLSEETLDFTIYTMSGENCSICKGLSVTIRRVIMILTDHNSTEFDQCLTRLLEETLGFY